MRRTPDSILRRLTAALVGGAMLVIAGGAHAMGSTPPTLMVLSYSDDGGQHQSKIDITPGDYDSPLAGKPEKKWAILAGEGLQGDARPADRRVEFYVGEKSKRTLVCAIEVRYYPDARGAWIPRYRLAGQSTAVPLDGRTVPIVLPEGVPDITLPIGNPLPNPEGYFPWLKIGVTTGLLQIDSWIVK